jgi:hypothetical protein
MQEREAMTEYRLRNVKVYCVKKRGQKRPLTCFGRKADATAFVKVHGSGLTISTKKERVLVPVKGRGKRWVLAKRKRKTR